MQHVDWAADAVFYHIYPLGLLGAPQRNDFAAPAVDRLIELSGWIDHLVSLGVTALYLGPLFESSTHGYDTSDYFKIDRRLGTDEAVRQFVSKLHARGIRVVLDAVLNHVGRDFWAFRDLRRLGEASKYRAWFAGVSFSHKSPYEDAFSYEGWNGHYELAKLNLANPQVRSHLFDAAASWVERYDIDGLRLDAADVLDPEFIRAFSAHCRSLKRDFWLMGEVIHGDYRKWVYEGGFDSVTNYECYKGLYSSHNDRNYFEIAYSLDRQFGDRGLYRDLYLYTFADNHDVSRIASLLTNPAHLYPLHLLLFTMPGIPAVYYGSEWGISGAKPPDSDWPLRPRLTLPQAEQSAPHPALERAIARLASIRKQERALRRGDYRTLHVAAEQLSFARSFEGEQVIVALNAASSSASFDLAIPDARHGTYVDLLAPGETFESFDGRLRIEQVPPCWGRILRRASSSV